MDPEEAMWKSFYEKLQEAKSNPPTEHESQIQDTDGGFFEKFGSLLRQKSLIEETNLSTPLAVLTEETFDEKEIQNESEVGEEEEEEEGNEEETRQKLFGKTMRALSGENENDSGTETLPDSDSDIEDPEAKKQQLIESCDMNIEELYEEVLHEILHNIGCETSDDVCQTALLEYVQDAFKIPNDVHERILTSAETKQPSEIRLNVEIIKAENLMPKDSNGLSDPFVTMYLESFSTHRYNTSVKSATLNPVWEEHFSLPISDNPNSEVLVLEVWDFDAAETVGEKMNKVFEVKGIKGFRKLMKEIAVTASTGKHDNELIGRTSIPLKSIPASGIRVWYSLDKNGKNSKNSRGSVLIHMSFSAEKNNRVAAQEHRHLLKILLMHELETSQVAQYWWRGKFCTQGEAILTQHSAQSGLSVTDCAMAQWSVFAQINQKHHLSFSLFNSLLDKIIPTLQTLPNDDDEVKLFWEGAKRLLPSCFSIIRKVRQKLFGDKHGLKILNEVLDIMSKIAMLEPPPGTDLLPKNIYGWIVRDSDDSSPNFDIRGALRDSVKSGALEWFEHINEVSNFTKGNEEDQLQHLIKLTQLVRTDLQQAIEYYDKIFKQKMHFNYAQTLYLFYEKKLAEYAQPIVEEVCRNIKRLNVSEDRWEKLPENEEINMGTTLFELYLVLKRFTTLGSAMCPGHDNLSINKYHDWFTTGVSHWLDISVYKALTRIEKAIDLDKLVPVDETVKYSSSAVDTLAIFYQIKIFWQQLGWPDAEGAYIFVSKIVDDICRCCVFYADRMSKRVEEIDFHINNRDKFEVTREWCLAINNIDYIRQSLNPFIKELGADEIIVKIGEYRSDLEAQRCSATIKNVIENAIDTERNKIIELIEEVARKMSPAMRRFLTEGAEILHQDSNSMDRIMMYLENALSTLNAELNEVNFERILEAIWCEISVILFELVQANLEKRRPPSFFSNLRDTLHVMVNSFKISNSCTTSDKETLENIERLLELHAFETAELIHQYYLLRLEDQRKMQEYPYGQLTVRGRFVSNVLHLEIMNARNLVPMDSDGSCDSFVKVHFMPSDKFLGVSTPKTSTQNKTLYPLYDEKFTIVLSDEQRKMSNAIMVFSIKDKDLFGMSNQYIAEAYLTFADFETTPDEQIHLGLSRPEYKDTDCLRALEHRQGDKQARDFLKKLKQKAY
ncbi:protein unc-13 homolog 4B isoform X2 [Condylostylus longicornis]|uniref:protein unc-13 homolog 4B isoform X2 n=1 Tax=Condylostylus longicornis TaxID=2530218 RepID=UPI00244DE0C4|nr:protein unc-13 homolog 4B isoform X2 [Condylostylus longicornis]